MNKLEYVVLNPVSNVLNEQKIMKRGHEPYLRIGGGIGWETVYNPIKCYFTNIDTTNIKEYKLEDFLYRVAKDDI